MSENSDPLDFYLPLRCSQQLLFTDPSTHGSSIEPAFYEVIREIRGVINHIDFGDMPKRIPRKHIKGRQSATAACEDCEHFRLGRFLRRVCLRDNTAYFKDHLDTFGIPEECCEFELARDIPR